MAQYGKDKLWIMKNLHISAKAITEKEASSWVRSLDNLRRNYKK